MTFVNLDDVPKVAIENPIGCMSTRYRKPDQIIQPYMFGETESKATCLWLKGLPPLMATELVKPRMHIGKDGKADPMWHYESIGMSKEERSRYRSKTFPGIARAMAEQWGDCDD